MSSKQKLTPLAWALSLNKDAFIFATRTTCAGLTSLGIGLWLEMESPAWALLFAVVTSNPILGASISKAQWCIAGTVLGSIAAIIIGALAPQAPWLFYLILSCWLGVCVFGASLCENYRTYFWSLAGFTSAIICLDIAPNIDGIFWTAISRVTYIVLGTTTATAYQIIFTLRSEGKSHRQMVTDLRKSLLIVTNLMADLIQHRPNAVHKARKQLVVLLALERQIEFYRIELGPYGASGQHAQACLSFLISLLSNGMTHAMRGEILGNHEYAFKECTEPLVTFLKDLPNIVDKVGLPQIMDRLLHIQKDLDASIIPKPTNDKLSAEVPPLMSATATFKLSQNIRRGIFCSALSDMLPSFKNSLKEYYLSCLFNQDDNFKFKQIRARDLVLATHNGIRASCSLLITAFIYEITAWPTGTHFLTISAVVSCLFSPQDHPLLGSINYFKGMVAAAIAAWFLVMIFMPTEIEYEALCFSLGVVVFLGALARAHPATAAAGLCYGFLLPLLIGFNNQQLTTEVEYYNVAEALLGAGITGILLFRTLLPYNLVSETFRLRRSLLKELANLTTAPNIPGVYHWIGVGAERFVRLVNHAGEDGEEAMRPYLMGLLATVSLGENVIALRRLKEQIDLPPQLERSVTDLLNCIGGYEEKSDTYTGRTQGLTVSTSLDAAQKAINEANALLTDPSKPLSEHPSKTRAVVRTLARIVLIAHVLKKYPGFLDAGAKFPIRGTKQIFATAPHNYSAGRLHLRPDCRPG